MNGRLQKRQGGKKKFDYRFAFSSSNSFISRSVLHNIPVIEIDVVKLGQAVQKNLSLNSFSSSLIFFVISFLLNIKTNSMRSVTHHPNKAKPFLVGLEVLFI